MHEKQKALDEGRDPSLRMTARTSLQMSEDRLKQASNLVLVYYLWKIKKVSRRLARDWNKLKDVIVHLYYAIIWVIV